MYKALYRTERPEVFSEVLGQDHILRVLKHQIQTDTVGHAYLFCGTRGTGKTTMARLLAKAVNCTGEGEHPCGECDNCKSIQAGTFPDMIEIDAASNNGVDNVREIRESVNYPPVVGRRKVYIIDEAHMLSKPALNALLKTLEEPPENVMFILATTDPQQLLQTIRSRCMRFDFRRIPEKEIAERMREICEKRGIKPEEDALSLLAVNADGSVRDGLSLLDQCISGSSDVLTREMVLDCLGTVSDEFFIRLTDCVSAGDVSGALVLLDEALAEGRDVKQMLADWLAHYRALLIGKYVKDPGDMLNMSLENISRVKEQSGKLSLEEIRRGIMTIAKTMSDARYSSQPRTLMELAVVTLASENGTAGAAGGDADVQTHKAVFKTKTASRQQPAPKHQPAPKQERAPRNERAAEPEPALKQERAPREERTAGPEPASKQERAPRKERAAETESSLKSGTTLADAPIPETAPASDAPIPETDPELESGPAFVPYDVPGGTPVPREELDDSAEDAISSDYEEIWESACEIFCVDLTDTMIKNSSILAAMNDKEFKVLAETDFLCGMIEKKRAQIQDAMERVTGKKRVMIVKTGTASPDVEIDSLDAPVPSDAEMGSAAETGSRKSEKKPSKEDYERLADAFSDEFGFKPKVR